MRSSRASPNLPLQVKVVTEALSFTDSLEIWRCVFRGERASFGFGPPGVPVHRMKPRIAAPAGRRASGAGRPLPAWRPLTTTPEIVWNRENVMTRSLVGAWEIS